ncbi:MAG: alpha/beta fold hydrolase [Acidobacteriia bacterium]|nr:alpha/beta fold hydrolase [Terriglobia bacterium]
MEISEELLHRPVSPSGAGMVLTHGAGANCRSALLVAVAEMLAESGVTVLRYDLPFRQKRPSGPPHPGSAAADQAGLREAVQALRSIVPGPVFLGGHSYGGRQATMLAAAEPGLVAGLLLLSYPLHPPDKPESLRTAHFPALQTRAAFVHGDRDDFGSPKEMQRALGSIAGETNLQIVPGAGHDLKKGKLDLAPSLVWILV